MTTESKTESTQRGAINAPLEAIVMMVILIAAVLQWTVGGQVSKTGEQVGFGIPVATIVLGVGVLIVLLLRRELRKPHLPWYLVLFLSLIPIGLLGLSRPELVGGMKELIQLAEIFVVSWYLCATASTDVRRRLARYIALFGVLFGFLAIGRSYEFIGLSETRYAGLLLLMAPFIVYRWRRQRWFLAATLSLLGVVQGYNLNDGGLLLGLMLILILAGLLVAAGTLRAVAPAVVIIGIASLFAPAPKAWDSLDPQYDAEYRKRLFIEYDASLLAPRHFPAGGGLGRYKSTVNLLKLRLPNALVSPEENKIRTDSNMQYLVTLVESGLPVTAGLVLLILASIWTAWRHKLDASEVDAAIARAVCVALVGLLWAGLFTTTLGRGIGIWAGMLLGWSNALRPLSRAVGWKSILFRLAPPALAFCAAMFVLLTVNREPGRVDHLSKVNQFLRRQLKPGRKRNPQPDARGKGDGLTIVKLSDLDSPDTANGKAKVVHVEGEAFTECEPPFQVTKANDSSGNEAIELPDNAGTDSGSAVYKVAIPKAGSYRLTARVWWVDGCGNSLGFDVDDSTYVITSERYKTWHKLQVRQILELDEGETEIRLRNLEDGIRLDYFELTRE